MPICGLDDFGVAPGRFARARLAATGREEVSLALARVKVRAKAEEAE